VPHILSRRSWFLGRFRTTLFPSVFRPESSLVALPHPQRAFRNVGLGVKPHFSLKCEVERLPGFSVVSLLLKPRLFVDFRFLIAPSIYVFPFRRSACPETSFLGLKSKGSRLLLLSRSGRFLRRVRDIFLVLISIWRFNEAPCL